MGSFEQQRRNGVNMWRLMAKFKMKDWEEFDKLDPKDGTDHELEILREHILNEYKTAFGSAYLFKWVKD